jgi:hypothetical protein
VWAAAPPGGGGAFEVDVRVRVPLHQPVLVRPALGEALKWGWVQFVAAFAAVWWLAARLEWAAFRLRVVATRTACDAALAPRSGRGAGGCGWAARGG